MDPVVEPCPTAPSCRQSHLMRARWLHRISLLRQGLGCLQRDPRQRSLMSIRLKPFQQMDRQPEHLVAL